MRNITFFRTVLFLCFLITFSCSESDDDIANQPPVATPPQEFTISGKIVPAINFNGVTVTSPLGQSAVSASGDYSITIPVDYSATFVLNSDGRELMMGYSYPGNPDSNIDAKSTALGMLMLAPAMIELAPEGKQQYITSILNSPQLATLTALINEKINNGVPLFENNTEAFADAYRALFSNLSRHNETTATEDLPIHFYRDKRTCYFNNSGKVYVTVVGVYKNNQLIDKFYIDGVKIIPGYLPHVLGGYSSSPFLNGGPDKIYQMTDNGQYEFKFYTGRGVDDGSEEFREAYWENLTRYSMSVVLSVLPQLAVSECIPQVLASINNTLSNDPNLAPENVSPQEVPLISSVVAFNNVWGWWNCEYVNEYYNWFTSAGSLINFVGQMYSMAGIYGANASVFNTQWNNSEGASKCFLAVDNSITDCTNPLTGTWIMVMFDNTIPVGQYTSTFLTNCPTYVNYNEYESGSYTFTDNSYSYTWRNTIVELNYEFYEGTCIIEFDREDTVDHYDEENGGGTFQFNGSNYILTATDGEVIPVQFLTPDKIKIWDQIFARQSQ